MLSLLEIFLQCIRDYLQMSGITDEIGIGSINENSGDIMLFDIARISLLQVEQVFVGYIQFIRAVALANILL
jgi:hypothetical protein